MSILTNGEFIDAFKNKLKSNIRTISIKTLLSDRNIKRINYKPYYQRNFVWDNEKQTFFIESVLLGTEIPPLILFKSGMKTEIIDGRQRFETLKRFKEDDLILTNKGLMELRALEKRSFNKLDESIKEIFLDSNIRIFEFETISNISEEAEDKIKREIFRRYNTGITPLTDVEVDAAKYNSDPLSNLLEDKLRNKDDGFYTIIKKCFFNSESEDDELIDKMVDFLRESYVLPNFPIHRYATGKNRDGIISLLYSTIVENSNSPEILFREFIDRLNELFVLYSYFNGYDSELENNKLLYQSLLWVICVLKIENVSYNFQNENLLNNLRNDIRNNLSIFVTDSSYHYKNIVSRYQAIQNIFSKYFKCGFEIYFKNPDFNSQLMEYDGSSSNTEDAMSQLESLRINKPAPISKPIEEILQDVCSNRYLIRPSYQRQEKITEIKASAIIESILLNIPLPPIFIFKRNDGIKEVIDGQQRLLTIIAFVACKYKNEYGNLVHAKINNFKLKKTNILNLKGLNYNSLDDSCKDFILDFNIDEIVIDESINRNFDPTDLFIRLNQKPYPIRANSFEMWNSTVNSEIIKTIKTVTSKISDWFFIKLNAYNESDARTDRMENEELITRLAYINYVIDTEGSYKKVLGVFTRRDRITCRINNMSKLTDYLLKLDDNNNEKKSFLKYITDIEKRAILFKQLLGTTNKDEINNFFNVKNTKIFRRSAQDFYIVWVVLHYVPLDNNSDIKGLKYNLSMVLSLLKNKENCDIADDYYDDFINQLDVAILCAKSI